MADHRKIPLKVAIIGGGLAGAILANALLKHQHIDVHIFEAAPEFSERGAAVGLAAIAQAALAEIGGSVAGVIERAGGVTMSSSRLCMASGPNAMSTVFDLAGEERGKVVHRAALLGELLKPLAANRKHTKKKVIRIEDYQQGDMTIHFDDGTDFQADAIVGADGLRGYVRGHVLGAKHAAVPARAAGFWDARALIPMKKARELLGEKYFEVDRQYGWIGDGGFVMHDVLDSGETVQCVISGMMDGGDWKEGEWSRELDRGALDRVVGKWVDPSMKDGVVEAMLQNPDLKAFAQEHHEIDAPTYAKDRVCIMGDAAHCMTPWQGSGAGQAIEDAMVLEVLFEQVRSPDQIAAAFRAYDEVRRPRTQGIVHSSYGTGLILCGRGPDSGVDLQKVQAALPERWAFIYGHDHAAHKKDALERFEALIAG